MKHFIKINDSGEVTAYCSSDYDQTAVGWIEIDKIPYDFDVKKHEYKYIDGKLLSPIEQENMQLKEETQRIKQEFAEKTEMLEMAIMDVADFALGGGL